MVHRQTQIQAEGQISVYVYRHTTRRIFNTYTNVYNGEQKIENL